jgi:hypothetical protein
MAIITFSKWKIRQKERPPVLALRPQRGPKSDTPQERRAGACRKNFDTGCIVENWPRCCPLLPSPRLFLWASPSGNCRESGLALAAASLPLNCPFLVRTGKARSSSRPCKGGLSERAEPVKTRLLARDRMVFFAPFLAKKITDPLLTGEHAEIRSMQDGAKPS